MASMTPHRAVLHDKLRWRRAAHDRRTAVSRSRLQHRDTAFEIRVVDRRGGPDDRERGAYPHPLIAYEDRIRPQARVEARRHDAVRRVAWSEHQVTELVRDCLAENPARIDAVKPRQHDHAVVDDVCAHTWTCHPPQRLVSWNHRVHFR